MKSLISIGLSMNDLLTEIPFKLNDFILSN